MKRRAYATAIELDESNPTILKAFDRASVLAAEWDDVERAIERVANARRPRTPALSRAALVAARARGGADARKADPVRAIELYQLRRSGSIRALPEALLGVEDPTLRPRALA